MNALKLDIGCGQKKKENFIGLDIINFKCVDIIHDIDITPFPVEENSVSEVNMDNVLEHVSNPVKTLEEVYRISINECIVHVFVPYFRSFYATIDPTHKNFFGVYYFNYFDPQHPFQQKYQYSNAMFQVIELKFDVGWDYSKRPISRLIRKIANEYPEEYEARLSHLFPLNSIYYKLKVVKQ